PYPYRRRRRRGDLTFLPGGAALTPPTQTLARPFKRTAARGLNHIIRAEKFVMNVFFFNPHV
ncbi:hypothetical protein ACVGW7_13890, partial [Enterobacter intestinihominis]